MADDKYKDLLEKYHTPEEQQDLQSLAKEADNLPSQSPSDTRNSFTPDTRDAGKQDKAGQDATVKEAGQTLHDAGVGKDPNSPEPDAPEPSPDKPEPDAPKDMLADYRTNSTEPQEPEQEQEMGR